MGIMSNAKCPSCGYSAGLTVGGCMRGFRENYSWPVSCSDCDIITCVNIRQRPLKCGNCGSENVATLGDPDIVTCAEDELRSGVYVCPRCKARTLRISAPTILFD